MQIPHRCINHFVLDSADSSEVSSTIQMHLLICNFSYFFITKEPDSETCISFCLAILSPEIFLKLCSTSCSFLEFEEHVEFWGSENFMTIILKCFFPELSMLCFIVMFYLCLWHSVYYHICRSIMFLSAKIEIS